jgi:phospholipid transport system substrate-binding protein
MMHPVAFMQSILIAAVLAVMAAPPAMALTPAETFISDNIHQGLDVLNNKALSDDQRRTQFQNFLLGMTDMQRIAMHSRRHSGITRSRPINPTSRNTLARH